MRLWLRAIRWAFCLILLCSETVAEQRVHTVAEGQTLGGIALHYGVRIAELTRANDIHQDAVIRLGQELKIPTKGTPSADSPPAAPNEKIHVVASGQTLSGIAEGYSVTTEALATANQLTTTNLLRVGQRLVIPPPSDDSPALTQQPLIASSSDMQTLTVPGVGPVYYYEPVGRGRLGLRPVIMYLHGRGGNPERDCRRWAPVARPFGWLVCPSGKGYRNSGRTWNGNWSSGFDIVKASLETLRGKFGRRVQLYGNTLVGFSEGAYVAMNVGARSPRAFNRWLLLGASDGYLGMSGRSLISSNRSRLRRIFLLTGERDGVVQRTRRAGEWFESNGVSVRIVTPPSLAHEVALERSPALYRGALSWLVAG